MLVGDAVWPEERLRRKRQSVQDGTLAGLCDKTPKPIYDEVFIKKEFQKIV